MITVVYPVSGEAALQWAYDNKTQETALEGNWTWGKTKTFYYKAMTSRTDEERQAYFAQTFKGFGHQVHLMQDMAVSAHVRNDGHPEETIQDELMKRNLPAGDLYFEIWAKKNYPTVNSFAANPVFPAVDLTKNPFALTPITQFYDSDKYTAGAYPDTSPTWGLAEYTNANFVSYDTIFTDNLSQTDRHYFPYPSYNSTCYKIVESTNIQTGKKQRYLTKICQGEQISRFAAASPLFPYLWPLYKGALKLDSSTHRDYAEKLVPRAVGYSAALLNYFFRGQVRLVPDINNPNYYLIQNNSDERMRGIFSLYYDDANRNRHLLKQNLGYGLMTLEPKGVSEPVTFEIPNDAETPGKYILVFQGTMGAESGAVAGYINSRILEITPPEQFIYSKVDISSTTQAFTELKVKVRNTSTEPMQTGTLQAIAKYKNNTDDPQYQYSAAKTKTINFISTTAEEYNFDFSSSPIPLEITDLRLTVVFRGKIDKETDAVAIGIKDLAEPTPIDIFNNSDRTCINGTWYASNSPEAAAAADALGNNNGRADETDIYPHEVRDIYIKISSPAAPVYASDTEYDFVVPSLAPSEFKRVGYLLPAWQFMYSQNVKWVPMDQQTDKWNHLNLAYMHPGTAVSNQTDLTSEAAICGKQTPCTYYKPSKYYSMRGTPMWWGGGVVFVNQSYPATSGCSGF